jgi:tetratricopeptide (TPR) repeat protein
LDEAEQAFRKAIAYDDHLARTFPDPPIIREETCGNRVEFGHKLLDLGKYAEAEKRLKEEVAALDRKKQAYPDLIVFRSQLARAFYHLGNLYYLTDRRSLAEIHFRRFVDLTPKSSQNPIDKGLWLHAQVHIPLPTIREPQEFLLQVRQMERLELLGTALCRAGRYQEGLERLEEDLKLGRMDRDFTLFFQALAHAGLGQMDRAREKFAEGQRILNSRKIPNAEFRVLEKEVGMVLQEGRK